MTLKLRLENIELKDKIRVFLSKMGSERELMYPAYQIDSPIGIERQSVSSVQWKTLERLKKEIFGYKV